MKLHQLLDSCCQSLRLFLLSYDKLPNETPLAVKRDKLTLPRRSAPQKGQTLEDGALRCRQKFLRFFPAGFYDDKYIAWEREYKWQAHQSWEQELNRDEFRSLLIEGQYMEIADRAVRIESRTNLLFSFEKMALRDAVRAIAGACSFATGLYDFLHGRDDDEKKFDRWCSVLAKLPRKKTRVLTWPLATVFGFIAMPEKHIFFKPDVTREAARQYGYPFEYKSAPTWNIYENLLKFTAVIRRDLRDLKPRDLIDIQSFIWVQGSDEFDE
jgi:hypothetical protein